MSKKFFPYNVVAQAQEALTGWNQVGTTLSFGTVNAEALSADIEAAKSLEAEIALLEAKLIDWRNQRDDVYLGMWDKVKRVRAGVKANYGDDSSQYELVGGTRTSDRKTPTRKVTA